MRKVLLGLVLFAATGASAAAGAAVTIRMTGSVYYVTPSMTGAFGSGDRATAWFTYDPASPGRDWRPGGVLDPSVRFYENAPSAGGMTVGSYRVGFGDAARMFVTDNEPTGSGPIDRVLFDDFGARGAAVAGRPLDVVGIGFTDRSATALDGLALPTSAATFAAFQRPVATLDWRPYLNAEHRIAVIFDSVVVTAVPEPATWAFMIVGLGAVGGVLRRRRGLTRTFNNVEV